MFSVSDAVCSFKRLARKECEQAAAEAAAATEALTPGSEPSVSVTPRGEGAIPLNPVRAKDGTDESASAGPSDMVALLDNSLRCGNFVPCFMPHCSL